MNETNWILQHEALIRLSCFLGVFGLMTLWEIRNPSRPLQVAKGIRWTHNIVLVVINSVVLRLILPTTATALALLAQQNNWGLLNYYGVPLVIGIIIAIVVMDLVIYLQHVMMHSLPLLWRLHRVHHADLDYDVTTGLRFHPLEIILSMLIKFSIILLLGPAVIAVIIFEVVLNAMAMFNHGNVSLPFWLDKPLRWFVVTPDMHRIHHSIIDNETNSNFGFNIALWDRLFGTYLAQPQAGHHITIGIHQYNDEKKVNRIIGMLLLPFRKEMTGYVINRRNWNKKGE